MACINKQSFLQEHHRLLKLTLSFLLVFFLTFSFAHVDVAAKTSERLHEMRLSNAAKQWDHAMPAGNGQIGALVFGNIKNETVILTHDDLFIRSEKPVLPDVSQHLPEMREKIKAGLYEEAQNFFKEKIEEKYNYRGPDSFHPAFNITVDMEDAGKIDKKFRKVNFETGEVTVGWSQADVKFERNLFVSRRDDVVVLRIRSSKAGAITCRLGLLPLGLKRNELGDGKNVRVPRFPANPFKPKIDLDAVPITFNLSAENEKMSLLAEYDVGGPYCMVGGEYGGYAQVFVKGGPTESSNLQLAIHGADEIVLLCKLFANESGKAAMLRTKEKVSALPNDYNKLLERHIAVHRELYLRATLDLKVSDDLREMTNEDLVAQIKKGKGLNAMLERLFDFGRYALICSSRPGTKPANLQGIWNGEYAPAWASDYHNDINIQMAYFQALPGNMAEITLPYFDFYESQLDDFRTNAQNIYGCRGILAPISHTTHGLMYKASFTSWTAGAAWLAQLFYDYWLYTGDLDFLEQRAVPFMKKVALFYQDFVLYDKDGKIFFAPSHSPENSPLNMNGHCTINATMDIALVRELLTNLCESCEVLGIEPKGVKQWRTMLKKLPDYKINKDGALKEWAHPDFEDNYNHRHLSHLYPLFPGFEITPELRPELMPACRVAVNERMRTPGTEPAWSFPLMACVYARLGDAAHSIKALERIIPDYLMPNLFMLMEKQRPILQFDASSGVAAAVLEMLVFSSPDIIKLLPALPESWPKGHIKGVRTRSGIKVDLKWDKKKKQIEIVLLSTGNRPVTVKFPGPVVSINMNSPKTQIATSEFGDAYRVIDLPPNEKVAMTVNF